MGTSDEIWHPIIGLEGSYEVSSHGRIRSVDREVWCEASGTKRVAHWRTYRGRIMKQNFAGGWGRYHTVQLGRGNSHRPVHRLVLEAFVGPCPEGMTVGRHLDDDPNNNHISNLAWGTVSDNSKDKVRNGHHFNNLAAMHLAKTHCPAGHPLSGENLYVYVTKEGFTERACRICRRESAERYEAKRTAKRRAARAMQEDGR